MLAAIDTMIKIRPPENHQYFLNHTYLKSASVHFDFFRRHHGKAYPIADIAYLQQAPLPWHDLLASSSLMCRTISPNAKADACRCPFPTPTARSILLCLPTILKLRAMPDVAPDGQSYACRAGTPRRMGHSPRGMWGAIRSRQTLTVQHFGPAPAAISPTRGLTGQDMNAPIA